MAPGNGSPTKATKTPAKRTVYPPAIPHIYARKKDSKKDENKTPQSNGCVNGNRDSQPSPAQHSQSLNGNANGQPSSSENAQTATVGPSPVESAAAVVAPAQVTPSVASVDSHTVVAAANGHPQPAPVALPNPGQVAANAPPTMNGSGLEFSPVEQHPGPFNQPHPSNGHHHHPSNGHHHRLSNGSLVQSLQDSRFPSPIPHFHHGFPPNSVPHLDRPGHPAAIRPHGDGPPAFVGESNGPLTAGSFHSQSSGHPDDLHRRLFPSMNGIPFPDRNGHGPMHVNGLLPADLIKQKLQHQADTVRHLQSCTVTPEFTDCVLELHFSSPQAFSDHPESHRLQSVLRLPVHRFILARSPFFREAMHEKELAPGGVLTLHLVGRYMRSDVVGAVLRSLYGWPLSDYIPYTDLPVRNQRDHMLLMLSYMAIGQQLQLPYVFGPAMQRAMTLLDWDTVALAIDYALPSVVMPDRGVGPFGLAELMDHATRFIIFEFPHDFVLDVTVGDSEVPRLPPLAHGRFYPGGSSQGPPMPDGQRLANPELQNIRFGDLSAAEQNGQAPPQRVPEAVNTLLSRILLNLPYEYLKAVLEAPSLGRTSDLARRLPIFDIIAEREARRLHALRTSDPELRAALEGTAAPPVVKGERDFHIHAMGFKEEVCVGDMPYLIHTWKISPPGSDTA